MHACLQQQCQRSRGWRPCISNQGQLHQQELCHKQEARGRGRGARARARLEVVDAVLAARGEDVLRGLPGAVRVRQVLPLPRPGVRRVSPPSTAGVQLDRRARRAGPPHGSRRARRASAPAEQRGSWIRQACAEAAPAGLWAPGGRRRARRTWPRLRRSEKSADGLEWEAAPDWRRGLHDQGRPHCLAVIPQLSDGSRLGGRPFSERRENAQSAAPLALVARQAAAAPGARLGQVAQRAVRLSALRDDAVGQAVLRDQLLLHLPLHVRQLGLLRRQPRARHLAAPAARAVSAPNLGTLSTLLWAPTHQLQPDKHN